MEYVGAFETSVLTLVICLTLHTDVVNVNLAVSRFLDDEGAAMTPLNEAAVGSEKHCQTNIVLAALNVYSGIGSIT